MAKILIFGDSITDGATDSKGGWADRLKQYFMTKNIERDIISNEDYWVYNLGISGNMTEDVLTRIEPESFARKIEKEKNRGIVFVFAIGINDSCAKGKLKPVPRTSDEQFSTNYQKLMEFAKKHTHKIVCIGLTPVVETETNPIYDEYWYKNNYIRRYNELIKSIALKNDAIFVEVFQKFRKLKNFKELFIDGLHPNDKGHEWMFDTIKPHILEALNK